MIHFPLYFCAKIFKNTPNNCFCLVAIGCCTEYVANQLRRFRSVQVSLIYQFYLNTFR